MTEEEKKKLGTVTEVPETQAGTVTPISGYQSKWNSQIDDVFGKIQNRKPFQYDVNADALYEQYKNQYINNGKLAMEDTMGQAATLTGGYGNSYAQSVGQQTYNRYLEGLNDRVPELYQMALNQYLREGDDLRSDYGLLLDRDNQDYGRYQDAAALAKSQVETMLSLGVRPSDDLINQSGLSQEYINAYLSKVGSGGGSGGGGSGSGRRGGPKNGGDEEVNLAYEAAKEAQKNGVEAGYAYVEKQVGEAPTPLSNGAKQNASGVGMTAYYKNLAEALKKDPALRKYY